MRALSQDGCLSLWERGRGLDPIERALLAIEAASGEGGGESARDWALGRRNRALVELRCACFGSLFRGWTECRDCQEKLEFQIDGRGLLAHDVPPATARVECENRVLRLPTSRDLASIAGERDSAAAALRLVQRCTIGLEAEGPEPTPLTEEALVAIGDALLAMDPLSEVLLHFDCPSCHCSFDRELDVLTFFWGEIEGRAKRLLREVHTLASAYGWSERDILALSPLRRGVYLSMVDA
jgi:hypothetical protein